MKTTIKCLSLALVSLMALSGAANAASPAAAADYVVMKPMDQVVSEGVRDCRGGEGSTVPLITWGADEVTIFANGNNRETQPGSIFADAGLSVTLKREDNFVKQVGDYLRCDSPYLRATAGQAYLAAAVTEKNAATKLVPIYQHSWSNGGDALVVKSNVLDDAKGLSVKAAALKGKTIVLQRYGPHVDLLFSILADAGLTPMDVKLVFVEDLVGFDSDNTPGAAFLDDPKIDAAMVIIPDALALTSGGSTGTGAEGSEKGAEILISTKALNRQVADMYFVRADYYNANKTEVDAFVHALMLAEEQVVDMARNQKAHKDAIKALMAASADILLDAPTATSDAAALWADAETVGYNGNVKFFTDANWSRNFTNLSKDIQTAYVELGMLTAPVTLTPATLNYAVLANGLKNANAVAAPRFDNAKVTKEIASKAASGDLEGVITFEITFQPNQDDFPADLYAADFAKVIAKSEKYAGAVITVEGHSDVLGYLKQKKAGVGPAILNKVKQSAKNLSVNRANAVRDALIKAAAAKGVTLDPSQFVVVGYGITNPKTGMCGADPCAPKSKPEWLSNMRVVFQIVEVEGEATTFELLD
jgi:outer membrane protein OmpA-like peptidoglycan-associated protein